VGNIFPKEIAEKLYTLLDDNMTLRTDAGECLKLPSDIRIVIETFLQAEPLPEFFSRVGTVFFSDEE